MNKLIMHNTLCKCVSTYHFLSSGHQKAPFWGFPVTIFAAMLVCVP